MQLTVLGSSGGYPEPGRACSGYLLQRDRFSIWIDAGTGTLDALQRIVNLGKLEGILLSHTHPDHWTDLPIALHRIAVTGEGMEYPPVAVYGAPDWTVTTGVAFQWYSDGNSPTPYTPFEMKHGDVYKLGGIYIDIAEVQHSVPTFAMRFERDSVLVYSADTAPCDALIELARDADVFLCEATLPPGEEAAISMNPEQAGQIARAAGVKQLILTHLLPGIDPEESCRVAAGVFDGPVTWAQPGRVFEI